MGADALVNGLAQEVPLETVEEAEAPSEALASADLGQTSAFTCPECHGTLWQIDDDRALRYRCRVGHAYSEETMLQAQGHSVESSLWAALRALEERVALLSKLSERARRRGHDAMAAMFDVKTRQIESDVKAIHALILDGSVLQPVGPKDA